MSEQWDAPWRLLSGGTSPSQWQITLPFASLADPVLGIIPANAVRKLRWTYSADLQAGAFSRSEFQVVVSNWTVTGSGRAYSIAGPGSRRIEDNSTQVQYTGTWASASGNFSGGTIQSTSTNQSSLTCSYTSAQQHSLYLGTRLVDGGTLISISVDGQTPVTVNLNVPGEDVLIRTPLGQLAAGSHTITATHVGTNGTYFYFDFLEIAIPASGTSHRDHRDYAGAGNRLGYRTFTCSRSGADSVDDQQSRIPRPGESLCRRVMVL